MDELDLLAADLKQPSKRFSLAPRLAKKPEPVKQPSARVGNNIAGARSDVELRKYLSDNATDKFPGFKYVIAQIDYMKEEAKGVGYTPTFRFLDKGRTVDEFFGADHEKLRDRLWLHSD